MTKTRGTCILATFCLFAFSSLAREHTALNGTWTLIPVKSHYEGQPVVQTGTVTINEREGNITVSRNFVYSGSKETFFYRDMEDSENSATIHTGKDLKSKMRWDHGVLKVTTTESGAVTVESYSLADDGDMIVNVSRPGHEPMTLVFERK
jgi:hypothetical protein